MPIAVLFPRFDDPAIEERYASWQAELLLRRDGSRLHFYDPDGRARDASFEVESEHVLVVTDPLVLSPRRLAERLLAVLERSTADAALPVTNETANPAQQRPPDVPYMTLREFEEMTARWQRERSEPRRVQWDANDPAVFLCRTDSLDAAKQPLRRVLEGRAVAISPDDYVHRWSSMRGQVRTDLLDRIGTDAKSVLEFGCGEGTLGAALKKRQRCRVVGIELDKRAAAIARRRVDDVYCGDAREIIDILEEKFDWIVGGDIVEHLDDPWSFLASLRRLAPKGGRLLLSLPNLANGSVVGDLLQGRLDYVYMGITCAGHLRFFTRRTIEEMLLIAGWTPVSIEPQQLAVTPQARDLIDRLTAAGIAFSAEDLTASGYYVTAENR